MHGHRRAAPHEPQHQGRCRYPHAKTARRAAVDNPTRSTPFKTVCLAHPVNMQTPGWLGQLTQRGRAPGRRWPRAAACTRRPGSPEHTRRQWSVRNRLRYIAVMAMHLLQAPAFTSRSSSAGDDRCYGASGCIPRDQAKCEISAAGCGTGWAQRGKRLKYSAVLGRLEEPVAHRMVLREVRAEAQDLPVVDLRQAPRYPQARLRLTRCRLCRCPHLRGRRRGRCGCCGIDAQPAGACCVRPPVVLGGWAVARRDAVRPPRQELLRTGPWRHDKHAHVWGS